MNTQYTIQHCHVNNEKLYGSTHGSKDSYSTICGIELDGHHWFITHNDYTGKITCKKCLKIIKNMEYTNAH